MEREERKWATGRWREKKISRKGELLRKMNELGKQKRKKIY